jgi:DNA-binding transcriptional ArsR family regulator
MSLEENEPAQSPPEPPPQPELRKLTDARTMRALTHPVRVAMLEALTLGGAMTATELGEQIGESPTTCSFHLRQLAKYGWVEEAGGGKGRARPWRLATIGFQTSVAQEDPDTSLAASALSGLFRERALARYRTWIETRAGYPRSWQLAAHDSEFLYFLTAEELEELNRQLHDLLMPWFDRGRRMSDPSQRPPGAVPVELLTFSYPLSQPEAPGTADIGESRPDTAADATDSQ